jgi:thiol-disulfide isomerase/thioredoxin
MPFPSFKSTLVFVAGFASCLLCLAVLVFGAYYFWLNPMAANEPKKLAQSLAPPRFPSPHPADFHFTMVDTNNKPVDFQGYRGRVIVLNFWATWCLPCQAELPDLGKLARHYAGQNDVAILCVSEELPAVILKNSPALASQAPLYSLNGRQTPQIYQSGAIPATYVIDKKGIVVFEDIGSANWSDASVIQFIDSLR